jgi:EAL domain-containing protein (putative c-di-GMP-specific phosphodiesterase class I)
MVIAEGIETAEEWKTLKEIGVSFGQGFDSAIPGPAFPILR